MLKLIKNVFIVGITTFALLTFAAASTSALDAPAKPRSGYILDSAQILSDTEELQLNQRIEALKVETSNEIGILTLSSLEGEEINSYSVDVGRSWGIGGKANNNGVLIVVSLEPRKIYIATGYGLEGAIPDTTAAAISKDNISPDFKAGQYYAGLDKGISAIQNAAKGEYTATSTKPKFKLGSILEFAAFLLFLIPSWFAAVFGKTKRWWPGAVFAGACGSVIGGLVHNSFYGAAWLIPLALVGGMFDHFVSKNYDRWKAAANSKDSNNPDRNMPWFMGGGGSGSGGGFGSFGGGSFGGGGGGSDF